MSIQKYYNTQDYREDQKVRNMGNFYPMIDGYPSDNQLSTKLIRELYDKHKNHRKPCCGVLE